MALQDIPGLSYSNCFKITIQVVRDFSSELELTHVPKIFLKDYQQFL
jgi:hypothetical protein